MDEGPSWFAPKRYGFGSGLPITWQGWALLIGYMAVLFGTAFVLKGRPVQLFAIAIPVTAAFIVICAKTTRGGFRWRWGEDD